LASITTLDRCGWRRLRNPTSRNPRRSGFRAPVACPGKDAAPIPVEAPVSWAAANPDDPDRAEILSLTRNGYRKEHLRFTRRHLSWAIFSVAPDAKGLILRAGDTNPFGGEDAYVNLGI
jgi:hypothetical protein